MLSPPILLSLLLVFTLTSQIQARIFSSGAVSIHKDKYGYYVEAGLSEQQEETQDPSKTVKMLLSLSSSDSILSSSCLAFTPFTCSAFESCQEESLNPTWINFTYFKTYSKYLKTELYLDYKYWNTNRNYVFHSLNCDINQTTLPRFGIDRQGIIAMGYSNLSSKNFLKSKVFSVSIGKDSPGGHLSFIIEKFSGILGSETLPASKDWHVSFRSARLFDVRRRGAEAYASSGQLFFDINSNAIGLPLETFKDFIKTLKTHCEIICDEDLYQPACVFTGTLPTFTLSFNDSSSTSKILFPPVMYAGVTSGTSSKRSFTLKFKAMDPSLTGPCFIPSWMKNSIVLDANFLQYNKVVFDQTMKRIMIYPAQELLGDPILETLITFFVILLILAVATVVIKIMKKGQEKKFSTNNQIQNPLIPNGHA